jgi:ribosomal 50S subunit-recycling heat shock protein
MRLDKYLQVTGLIKRRVQASEACRLGLVKVNNTVAKATREMQWPRNHICLARVK